MIMNFLKTLVSIYLLFLFQIIVLIRLRMVFFLCVVLLLLGIGDYIRWPLWILLSPIWGIYILRGVLIVCVYYHIPERLANNIIKHNNNGNV